MDELNIVGMAIYAFFIYFFFQRYRSNRDMGELYLVAAMFLGFLEELLNWGSRIFLGLEILLILVYGYLLLKKNK